MKKIISLIVLVLFTTNCFATTEPLSTNKPVKASEFIIPLGNNKFISLEKISTMNASEFEKISGKKLGFVEKIAFKLGQNKLKKSINADGTVNNKKLEKLLRKSVDGETGFHLGGFALGFFLGLLGVLIAYLIKDDNSRNRRKWAWFGFGIWIAVLLILVAVSGSGGVY